MNPRRYDMSSREIVREATRRRILEATLALHTEKGIFGTSWKDIAERADVSIGTVYRHFPSLAELVPACGELLFELTAPPSPDDAPAVIGAVTDPLERLVLVGRALFAFYERAGAHIDTDARERELPEVQEWEEYLRATVTAFVSEALRGHRVDARTLQLMSAFYDYRTYSAIRARGVSSGRAVREVAGTVAARLGLVAEAAESRTGKDRREEKA